MNFLDKLDDEQLANAELVAQAARRAGVDPKLAVAIAFKESSLRANPPRGSSGEIGIMQVMPGTGRGIGFNEKQLGNLESNIEAGIKYLKKGLEATGNDPKLAAIYYNGGPGAIQALSSGKDPDPRVVEYIRSINSFGTFGQAPKAETAPAAPAAAPTAAPPAATPAAPTAAAPQEPVETDEERNARIQRTIDETKAAQDRRMGQLYGGGVGAGISVGRMLGSKGAGAVEKLGEAVGRGLQTGMGQTPGAPFGMPPAPSGGLPQTTAPTQGQRPASPGSVISDAGYLAKGETGAQVYNTAKSLGATDIEAAEFVKRGFTSADVYKYMQEVRSQGFRKIEELFPNEKWREVGNLLIEDQGVGKGPKERYVQPSEPQVLRPTPRGGAAPGTLTQLPPTQPIPAPSGLQTVTQELRALARPVVGALGTVARYAGPPAGLAMAGGEAADVYGEMRKDDPDYIKAALSGITGLSGLAALYPPAMLPAAVIGGTAGMANYLRGRASGEMPPSVEYVAP